MARAMKPKQEVVVITSPEAARADAVAKFAQEIADDLAKERSQRHFQKVMRSPDVTFAKLFEAADLDE